MDFTAFILYCFIITFTPGPTNIVILSTVHNNGTRKAVEYTFGATIAFGLLLVFSTLLNSILLGLIPKILILMQIIGTIYMFYLAYKLYKAEPSNIASNEKGTFMSGFLMQFLNPKVVIFTVTVIPSYVMPYYTEMTALSLSVVAITLIGFLAFMAWVTFGRIFKSFLQKHNKIVNILMSIFLAYSGVMIWL